MNDISKTIGWADKSLNPVVGCTYGLCPFCYARKMNDRFKWIEDFSKPQFFPDRLKALYSKKSQVIFMDSMSDIADWKYEWKEQIFMACEDNPQHKYLFLTKRPVPALKYPWHSYFYINQNWWVGVSINTNKDEGRPFDLVEETANSTNRFLSIEPILENIDFQFEFIDWVIVGAETGNRKGKIIPKREWITDILAQCQEAKIPVFMKSSLKDIWGEPLIQEFPW